MSSASSRPVTVSCWARPRACSSFEERRTAWLANVKLTAAIVKLQDRELEIRRLAECDESFGGLCEDLADATLALDDWRSAETPHVTDRISEYQSLIEALVAEMQASLDAATKRMDESSSRVSSRQDAD